MDVLRCNLRIRDYGQSIEFATKALDIDGECKKGLIRRGLSLFEMGQFEEAKLDMIAFQKLAVDEKERKLVRKYLNKIQAAKQRALEREKQLYGGFLDKKSAKRVSLYDDKEKEGGKPKDEEGFWWSMLMAIPNFVMEMVSECTRYCRKKDKSD